MADMMQYTPGTGLFHRTNAMAKIVFTVAMLFAAFLINDIFILAGLVVLVLAAAAFSGLLKELLRQIPLLIVLGLLLVVLTVLTMPSGDVLFYLIPGSLVSSGQAHLPVTTGAVAFAVTMSLRFAVLVFSFQIFVMSTQPRDMVNALYRLHVPGDYTLMFLIAMRFIPTLQREGTRINEAQLSRGYAPHGGLIGKIEQLGPVVLPMMLNAVAKADTLGLTIDMRGYRKTGNSGRQIIYGGADIALILFSVILVAALAVLRFVM
ncbi:energy-coupling factor transporter transmembrane protein EcfT [Methanosarcinaceae archaeon]|nr:energy-coupling factor transporter transmembrane protein EcfT [Methanosarcinaceae archaeon]